MPPRYHMTYVKKTKRWTKMYKGERFWVSCLTLGTPATKEDSWQMANLWWEDKLAKIAPKDAAGSEQRKRDYVNSYTGRIVPDDEFPQAYEEMLAKASKLLNPAEQTEFFSHLYGVEKYEKLRHASEEENKAASLVDSILRGEPAFADTIGEHVAEWLNFMQLSVTNGTLAAGSYDTYQREIKRFVEFAGSFAPVKSIDADRLEGFFIHLSKQEGTANSKKMRFSTAKMFIRRLFEKGKIELPRNINSDRFAFKQCEAKKETWSNEQWNKAYSDSTGIRRLCLLLAANCGFYSSDIGKLGRLSTEPAAQWVDLQAGIVQMSREKTAARICTWVLWQETSQLLRTHMKDLAPLYSKRQGENGRLKKSVSRVLNGLKQLRHTSCTFLENSHLKPWQSYFAGHAAQNMAEKHYGKTGVETAREISAYLRSCYFPNV